MSEVDDLSFSDIDGLDDEVEDIDDDLDEDEELSAMEAEMNSQPKRRGRKPGKVEKHPIPDGYDTPADFTLLINFEGIAEIDSTYVYNLVNNSEKNGFPIIVHTDKRKLIVRADAIEWIKEHSKMLEEKRAARAARVAKRKLNVRHNHVKYVAGQAATLRSA